MTTILATAGGVARAARPGLSVLLAFLCVLALAPAAEAAGYWTCVDGQWRTVGNPAHPMPLKACGAELAIPRGEAACLAAGGRWGPAGLFPKPICRMPTHDGGRVCGDDEECEGYCLATLTQAEKDRLRARQPLAKTGTCTPITPVFGCMAVVERGIVTGLLCRD